MKARIATTDMSDTSDSGVNRAIVIALAKGRMQEQSIDILEGAGLRFSADLVNSRKLTAEDDSGTYRLIFVKPSDVPVYVEHGIADCGVVGRDVLLESGADLLQPVDLLISACRIAVASPAVRESKIPDLLRVATKYPFVAASHFDSKGIPTEIIKLSGSVELAPLLGLSDCIVDLVESGRTLAENGLVITEVISESTGRFVVNRTSFQLKRNRLVPLIESIREEVKRIQNAHNI